MPLVLQQMIYSDQSRPKKVKWNTLIIHLQWILRLSTNPNGSPSQPDHSAWHTTKNKNSGGAWQRAQGINLASWQTDSWVATQRTQRIHHQRPGVGHNRTPQVIQCPGWLNECQDPKSPCRSLRCNAKNCVIHITWQSFYCFDRSVCHCSSLFFRTVLHTQTSLQAHTHTQFCDQLHATHVASSVCMVAVVVFAVSVGKPGDADTLWRTWTHLNVTTRRIWSLASSVGRFCPLVGDMWPLQCEQNQKRWLLLIWAFRNIFSQAGMSSGGVQKWGLEVSAIV